MEGAREKVDTAASADYWNAVVDEFSVVCMNAKHNLEMVIVAMKHLNRQNLKAEDRRRLVLRNNKTKCFDTIDRHPLMNIQCVSAQNNKIPRLAGQ